LYHAGRTDGLRYLLLLDGIYFEPNRLTEHVKHSSASKQTRNDVNRQTNHYRPKGVGLTYPLTRPPSWPLW